MSVATKRGDGGQTGLAGGVRVSKTHPRVECYGTIDELISQMGLAGTRFTWARRYTRTAPNPLPRFCEKARSIPFRRARIACSGRVWGTYVHGLFDEDAFRHKFVDFARQGCGLALARSYVCVAAERQARIDRWASHLRQSLNVDLIQQWANLQ